MSIEHEYFGVVGGDGGSYWSEVVDCGDQSVEVVLQADGDELSEESLDVAAGMVSGIEDLDADVREAFVAELARPSTPTAQFLADVQEALEPEDIEDAIARESGDREIDILRSLVLERVEFRPANGGEDEAFAVFEYSFAADESDARLIASVDRDSDVVDVQYEG
ncbi:hypothetical protein ARHIZOSPH14_28890 [Agromyces rhizosphaerae]|uniref:DUF2004 domain-containing protein n=1 Tax=Agromyces rhizosphaerae TaxID=88374 RepID=A0A9W6CXV7_9MICO|nr:DUF2004 domain-containing protein [Agromyces rhizosphaerae]GLI28647.1 hypothetical protein ARHIZOSPH14_28890 [Agromyces rhizosphaerae]